MIKIDSFEAYRVPKFLVKEMQTDSIIFAERDILEYGGKRKSDIFLIQLPGEKNLRYFPQISKVIMMHPKTQWFNLEILEPKGFDQIGLKGRIFTYEFQSYYSYEVVLPPKGETPEV